jgi:mediator of RNA polymerase II transcription subunit 31
MSTSTETPSSDPAAVTAAMDTSVTVTVNNTATAATVNNTATAATVNNTATAATAATAAAAADLPEKRFELELEFVQALASPAYLHFLATSRVDNENESTGGGLLLQDPAFQNYLKYLFQTWTKPEYSRFISYPHCLYFLQLLIDKPAVLKEWTLPAFRNFCHQQQFMSWQHRHEVLYGKGGSSDETGVVDEGTADTNTNTNTNTKTADETNALEQDGGTAAVAMDTDSAAPDRS